MDLKNWKLLGAGLTVAVLTSCGDGKEKVQQDAKEKSKTEKIIGSQKIISELSSARISVVKAGEKGKPDSLLSSIEKEGNVYSNPKYQATDDVSKALGIEPLSYEIKEVKLNRADATKCYGGKMGFGMESLKIGDSFRVDGGYMVKIIDDNAHNSMKYKIRYDYKDVSPKKENKPDFSYGKTKSVNTDKQADKASGSWNVHSNSDNKFTSVLKNEKASYGDEFVEVPLEVINNKMVVFIEGEKYSFDFEDLSKANIVRDAKLPKKPKVPERKIGDALTQTLADRKKNKR